MEKMNLQSSWLPKNETEAILMGNEITNWVINENNTDIEEFAKEKNIDPAVFEEIAYNRSGSPLSAIFRLVLLISKERRDNK